MASYVRKIKRKNGSVSVQIEHKNGRERTGITHIGTAHNDAELKLLCALAYEKMHEGQMSFLVEPSIKEARLKSSFSELLWDTLEKVYDLLGLGIVNDAIFKQLVLARLIEPASKHDTIRILANLGLKPPSYTSIHRSLKRVIEKEYREQVSKACFSNATRSSLMLVLYDVTTLYFEVQKEDDYRKPGLSKERRLEPQITVDLFGQ